MLCSEKDALSKRDWQDYLRVLYARENVYTHGSRGTYAEESQLVRQCEQGAAVEEERSGGNSSKDGEKRRVGGTC